MKMKKLIIVAVLWAAFLFPAFVLAGSQTTSSLTAATFITQARYYLNEDAESFWTDAELLQWLNDGTMDIVARSQCLETTESVTMAAGTNSYALASSFLRVRGAIYNSSKGLRMGSLEHMGDVKDIGEPSYFFNWGNNLVVYPAPDATAAAKTLVAYIVSRPARLAATTSSVLVPAQYDKALVLYMVAQGLKKDEKFARAAQVMAQYQAELDRFRQDLTPAVPLESIK